MSSASQLRGSPDLVPLYQGISQLDPLTSTGICHNGTGTDEMEPANIFESDSKNSETDSRMTS